MSDFGARSEVAASLKAMAGKFLLECRPASGKAGLFLVTSMFPKEGKSSIALNLSILLAGEGRKTMLVLAGETKNTTRAPLELEKAALFTDLLSREPKSAFPRAKENAPFVSTLDCRDNLHLFASRDNLVSFLEMLRNHFEFVIIDGPSSHDNPALEFFAPIAKRVLIVAKAERTRRMDILSLGDRIEKASGSVAGIVLTSFKSVIPAFIAKRL